MANGSKTWACHSSAPVFFFFHNSLLLFTKTKQKAAMVTNKLTNKYKIVIYWATPHPPICFCAMWGAWYFIFVFTNIKVMYHYKTFSSCTLSSFTKPRVYRLKGVLVGNWILLLIDIFLIDFWGCLDGNVDTLRPLLVLLEACSEQDNLPPRRASHTWPMENT